MTSPDVSRCLLQPPLGLGNEEIVYLRVEDYGEVFGLVEAQAAVAAGDEALFTPADKHRLSV